MEENSPISENLSDWEQIQTPYRPHPTPTASAADSEKDGYIFPPDHHEGLPLPPPLGISPTESVQEEGVEVGPARGSSSPLLCLDRVLRVGLAVGNFMRRRGVFWGFGSVAGAVAAAWVWVRIRRWQQRLPSLRGESGESLMELIRERDQKIKQLMLQIAQMNKLLSAQRHVPVIRITS